MKYTAIYTESWQAGSHTQTLPRMKRFERNEGETLKQALAREEIDSLFALFLGWPLMDGEQDEKEFAAAPEPDWTRAQVSWVKWYRNVHGCTLKEAVDEGRRRHADAKIVRADAGMMPLTGDS